MEGELVNYICGMHIMSASAGDMFAYHNLLMFASEHGKINYVTLALSKGVKNFNKAMLNAAKGQHIDIVALMLENGAGNYDECIDITKSLDIKELISTYKQGLIKIA